MTRDVTPRLALPGFGNVEDYPPAPAAWLGESGLQALRCERNLADASAGRVKDRIGNRGCNDCDRKLACSRCLLVGPVDHHDLYLWDVEAQGKGRVGPPIDRSHLLLVPGHLFHERTAHALESASFGLIPQ